jgi:hypothetical protein
MTGSPGFCKWVRAHALEAVAPCTLDIHDKALQHGRHVVGQIDEFATQTGLEGTVLQAYLG